MVAGLEQAGDELCVRLEVDPVDGRIGREPGSVENDELEALVQRQLSAPGRLASDDTAVHEYEALHRTILDVQRTHHFLSKEREIDCYKLADMLRPR